MAKSTEKKLPPWLDKAKAKDAKGKEKPKGKPFADGGKVKKGKC